MDEIKKNFYQNSKLEFNFPQPFRLLFHLPVLILLLSLINVVGKLANIFDRLPIPRIDRPAPSYTPPRVTFSKTP